MGPGSAVSSPPTGARRRARCPLGAPPRSAQQHRKRDRAGHRSGRGLPDRRGAGFAEAKVPSILSTSFNALIPHPHLLTAAVRGRPPPASDNLRRVRTLTTELELNAVIVPALGGPVAAGADGAEAPVAVGGGPYLEPVGQVPAAGQVDALSDCPGFPRLRREQAATG